MRRLHLTLLQEIRLIIYGYLFLEPPRVYLDAEPHDKAIWHFVPGTLKPRKIDVELQIATILQIPTTVRQGMFNQPFDGYYRWDQKSGCLVWSRRLVERHLAILRTSRLINNEASALLHSDLIIDIKPGDASPEVHGYINIKRPWHVWRHDPSKGLGSTNTSGQKEYKSRLLDGYLEPHVFARFEKVSYRADFSLAFHRHAPRIHINDDLSVRAEDAVKFVSYLTTTKRTTRWFEDPISGRSHHGRRETLKDVAGITISSITVTEPSPADVVQKLVDLLSNSPFIRHLEVRFYVAFSAGPSFLEDLSVNSDVDPDSEQEAENAKTTKKREAASLRVTELFLESGVLNCLRKLSNVKYFSLVYATTPDALEIIKLQRKHLKIIRDLKEAIEKNWMVKHGPR